MDFWKTILVLFRRWYIALPAFMLAVAAASAVYVTRPLHYSSYSILVLTASTSGATQRADPTRPGYLTNPLLDFDRGLDDTAAILIQAVSTPETSDQLGVSPSGDPTYQVTNGSNNPELLINSPLVVITGQSTSPGKVQDIVVRVAQRVRQELVNRQRELKAPQSTYIVLSEVVRPTAPQPQRNTNLRPAVSALALGCIASIAAVFGAESVITYPRRHRRAQLAAVGGTATGAAAESGEAAQMRLSPFETRLPSGADVLDDERQR